MYSLLYGGMGLTRGRWLPKHYNIPIPLSRCLPDSLKLGLGVRVLANRD